MRPQLSIPRPSLGLLLSLSQLLQRSDTQAAGCGSKGATRTISESSDAAAIASCTVFTGSIAVATSFSGGLEITGVQEISENLSVQNVNSLLSLEIDDLRRVGGNFTMNHLIVTSTLSLGSLTSAGAINLVTLPNLSEVNLAAGLTSVASLVISDTFLSTLDGFGLKTAANVQITHNIRLKEINFPLEKVDGILQIGEGGFVLDVALPELTSAGTLRLENISALSIPKLSSIAGSFILQSSEVESLILDGLSVIPENLTLHRNTELQELSLKNLISATAIDIQTNNDLKSMSFPALSRADTVIIDGFFTDLTMPNLALVSDIFRLTSIEYTFNCTPFDTDRAKGIIKGTYTCDGTHAANPTNSNSGNDEDVTVTVKTRITLSGKAIAGIAVGGIVVFAAGVTAVSAIVRRLMKKKKSTTQGVYEGD